MFRATYRIGLGTLILVTLAQSFFAGPFHTATSNTNFFSYFTNESNLIAAITLLYAAIARRETPLLSWVRGGSMLYLTTTLLINQLVLDGGLSAPVLHIIAPLGVLLDWLLFPPAAPISLRGSLAWLSFPFAFVVYTLARGALVHWYPYAFLDPTALGLSVLAYILVLGTMTLLLARIIQLSSGWRQLKPVPVEAN
jgi:hypothetical protein